MADRKERFVLELSARDQAERVLKALGRTGFVEARRLGKEFESVEKELKRVERTGKSAGDTLRDSFGKFGRFMRASVIPAVLATVAAVAGFSVLRTVSQNAAEFELALAEVATIAPSAGAGVGALREEVLDLALAQGELESVVTRGLYQTVSAGITDTADALEVLGVGGRLAVAGLSQTSTTVDLLTSVLNAFSLDAADAERVADVLFTTVRLGKTTIDELGGSIARALPPARALGVEFEEVAAAIATLTKQGFDTNESVTLVSALFAQLAKRAPEIDEAMRAVGGTFDDTTLQTRSLADVLQDLRSVVGDSLTTAFDVLGDRREAILGLFGLTGAQAQVFRRDLADVDGALGALGIAFDTIAGTDARRLEAGLIAVRQGFLDLGRDINRAIAQAIDSLGGAEAVRETFRGLGAVISPIVTEGINSLAQLAKQFVVTSADIEGAARSAEVFAIQVRGAFRSLNEFLSKVPGLGDLPSEFQVKAFGFDNAALQRQLARKTADNFVAAAQDAIDNLDPLALRFEADLNRLAEIQDQIATAYVSDFARLDDERLQIMQRIAAAAREEFDARKESRAEAAQQAREDALRLAQLRADQREAARFEAAGLPRELPGGVENVGPQLPPKPPEIKLSDLSPQFSQGSALAFRDGVLEVIPAVEALQQAWEEVTFTQGLSAKELETQLAFNELLLPILKQTASTEEEKLRVADLQFEAIEREVRAAAGLLTLNEDQKRLLDEQLELLREKVRLEAVEPPPRRDGAVPGGGGPQADTGRDQAARLEQQLLASVPTQENQVLLADAQFASRERNIVALEREGAVTTEQAKRLRDLNKATLEYQTGQNTSIRLTQLNEAAVRSFVAGGLGNLENTLANVIVGTESAKEAFRNFAKSLILDLIKLAIRLAITNGLLVIFDSIANFGAGTALALQNAGSVASAQQTFSNVPANIAPLATGGLVTEPTLALIGEAGPEAVIPLTPPNAAQGVTPFTRGGAELFSGNGSVYLQPVIVLQSLDAQSGLQFVARYGEEIASDLASRIGVQSNLTDAIRSQGSGGPPGIG